MDRNGFGIYVGIIYEQFTTLKCFSGFVKSRRSGVWRDREDKDRARSFQGRYNLLRIYISISVYYMYINKYIHGREEKRVALARERERKRSKPVQTKISCPTECCKSCDLKIWQWVDYAISRRKVLGDISVQRVCRELCVN